MIIVREYSGVGVEGGIGELRGSLLVEREGFMEEREFLARVVMKRAGGLFKRNRTVEPKVDYVERMVLRLLRSC